ncbi:GNAT family N-acetyltransferase [Actinospica sp.]|uniref:GNAT family N-acetyltransferase n=1 Tax=Actinospica sp. TaxID=1872142 RepID=UPI002BC5455B|nr:GNAT family N-acetyltransferase [Actinospica sp.]HWG24811.1 GNAT family N-acetyltransferase [Actinospica sp.]
MTADAHAHVLDRPVAASLAGHHAAFARRHGRAVRFDPDVAVFAALDDASDQRAWDDAVHLLEPDAPLVLPGVTQWPDSWELTVMLDGVQLEGSGVEPLPDAEAVVLGSDDVPEILDLIARTDPGPFRRRTIELGTYLGIRRESALIAMAGERMHPPGWTEISAVCTDPAYRGQGLGGRLVRAVAAGIMERGETPFLHAAASNESALRLYEKLGFTVRRAMPIPLLTPAR